MLLAEVATRTSRIRIGTGVLNIWGRSAAQIAMLATSLHEISDGRFVLGLGAGSPALAEGLHDVAFRAPVQRLAAVTRQVRALLDGGRVTPAGGGRGLRLAVGPSPVPIVLAALGPAAIRLTGEVADSWGPFLFPVSALQDGIRLAEGRRRRSGRCRQVCPCIPAAVSPDPDQARALASWWVEFYLTKMGPLYPARLRQLGLAAAVDEVTTTGRHVGRPAGRAHPVGRCGGRAGGPGTLLRRGRRHADRHAAAEPERRGTRLHTRRPAAGRRDTGLTSGPRDRPQLVSAIFRACRNRRLAVNLRIRPFSFGRSSER